MNEGCSNFERKVLEQADAIIVDSVIALRFARRNGLSKSAKIYTSSPEMVSLPGVIALENDVSSGDIKAFGEAVDALRQEIFDTVSRDKYWAHRAITFARVVANLENLAYRAWLLSKLELNQKIVLVEHPAVTHSLKTSWHILLSELSQYCGRIDLPYNCMPPMSSGHNTVPPMRIRLGFETWESIAFRFFIFLPSWIKNLFSRRGQVLIISENGLIKETGAHLGLKGFGLAKLKFPPKSADTVTLPENLKMEFVSLVEKSAAAKLSGPIFSKVLSSHFIQECEFALGELDFALRYWHQKLEKFGLKRTCAVMTNYNASPTGEALFECCQRMSIPHICAQHGTGVELSLAGHNNYRYGEAANSGTYITYSDVASSLVGKFKETRAQVISVGQPRDLADVSRHSHGAGPHADIFYISTQALFGHVTPPSALGISDLESFEWEKEILRKVLARLPHSVLYKPYRSIKYLDGNPLLNLAKTIPNISVYEGYLDLRYMLPNARVLVVAHAASTLSWCLMSNKPVIYINEINQSELFPEFEKEFRDGGIIIDANSPNFIEEFHEMLSRPLEVIETEWVEKEPIRKNLIERFLGKADGKAGRRMAKLITEQT